MNEETTEFDLNSTVDLLTPLFDPVVRDIQAVEENTKNIEELLKQQIEQSEKQVQVLQEEIKTTVEADSANDTKTVEEQVEETGEVTEEQSAEETGEVTEEQSAEETGEVTEEQSAEETEEVAVEEEAETDYLALIYEEIQMQNEQLAVLVEGQEKSDALIVEGVLSLVLAVVITITVKAFIEQVTKW